jgi:hypothetical protein
MKRAQEEIRNIPPSNEILSNLEIIEYAKLGDQETLNGDDEPEDFHGFEDSVDQDDVDINPVSISDGNILEYIDKLVTWMTSNNFSAEDINFQLSIREKVSKKLSEMC